MIEPDFVNAGEAVKASTINSLISNTRNRARRQPIDYSGEARIYRPFDPISINFSEESWRIVLKPSWIIENNEPKEITFEVEEEQIDLSNHPEIAVETGKNLYLDTATKVLTWETPPDTGKLLILEVTGDETEGFEFINKYPSVIHIGQAACPFGQIVTITPAEGETPAIKGIKGGVVYAGDKNWNVEPYEVNLGTDGEWLVWLEVGVTANSEDGLSLPNLETSTAPTWEKGSLGGGYPAMTQPNGSDPTGTAIVPLGTLTVEDGSATFSPNACGDVRIGYCPTNLSVDRINTIIVESTYYYY